MKNNISSFIPNHIWQIIFEFDGRIKYIYKRGIFVNIIHKKDIRYDILEKFLNKKIKVIEKMEMIRTGNGEFYIDIPFEKLKNTGLVYDCNWSYNNKFEICYYNFRNDFFIIQTRTCLF